MHCITAIGNKSYSTRHPGHIAPFGMLFNVGLPGRAITLRLKNEIKKSPSTEPDQDTLTIKGYSLTIHKNRDVIAKIQKIFKLVYTLLNDRR